VAGRVISRVCARKFPRRRGAAADVLFGRLALGFLVVARRFPPWPKSARPVISARRWSSSLCANLAPADAVLVLARVGTANVIELGTARALGEVEALERWALTRCIILIVPRVIGMTLGIFSLTVYLISARWRAAIYSRFCRTWPMTPGDYFKQIVESLNCWISCCWR